MNVKHLRTFILVLLAALLPVRGAVAASFMCPAGQGPGTSALAELPQPSAQSDPAMHAEHPSAHHHGGEKGPSDDSSAGEHPATCHLCASGCCMASMVGTLQTLGQPSLAFTMALSAPPVPIQAFQSDGQDRPPRTS